MRKASVVAAIAVMLVASFAIADEIKRKDGQAAKGTIVKEDDESITIKTNLGDVTIPKKEIEAINGQPANKLDADLARAKAKTIAALEAIEAEAQKSHRGEVAQRIRDMITQARTWSLRADGVVVDAPAPKEAPPTKPKAGTADECTKILRSWNEAKTKDPKHAAEIRRASHGKRFSFTLVPIKITANGGKAIVECVPATDKCKVRFESAADAQVLAGNRGEAVTFEADLEWGEDGEPAFVRAVLIQDR